jgi:hypothetical protein
MVEGYEDAGEIGRLARTRWFHEMPLYIMPIAVADGA